MGRSQSDSARFRLQAKSLTGVRGDQTLFKDLSFDLPSSSGLRIAGPNGSGKTTLLRMLAGLSRPAAGKISLLADKNSSEASLSLAEHRSRVMYLGHNPGLNLRLNAVENLCFWLNLQRDTDAVASSSPLEIEEACRQALEMVGLYEQQLLSCSELSAGQKRRASIARVFLDNRYIAGKCLWVLDEPLTSLDKSFSQMLMQRVAAHVDEGGLLVLTTHQNPDGIDLAELELGGFG